jgi:predicted nucleotidyltransferase component of viral defense system
MISRGQITELRDKWRTTELNVAREYVQHVLLSSLFSAVPEAKLAFKGGTALRILRQSPRFSEDLDFTGWAKGFHVGEWLKTAVREASRAGLELRLVESGPTSGGWLALTETRVHEWPIKIEWNISLRDLKRIKTETVLATSPLWPAYSVQALPVEDMTGEKIEALFRRQEPRDYFDLYFLLRQRLGIKTIVAWKPPLLKAVKRLTAKALERELKEFLPLNQRAVAKQLPALLVQELERL